ncbi:hypothetical protein [Marinobacter zhejiangensis]|uniref:Uncharacterized protein n=1 Tax=Marinobacter zhejiangensis TaxID=488535 RepID=A0A1I4RVQ0_9GAMM|nr:hypothetical protein [Marinobacter zhejiangensis]SFM56271.1 hypothetical protein SAMN04487963_2975 [Marinobacter zhejiangensis]
MDFWLLILANIVATSIVITSILTIGYIYFLKPYLNSKVEQLLQAADGVEERVAAGVKRGVSESLKEIPEAAAKDSTRQFLRFGSELFENGLSSFLGSVDDLARKDSTRRNAPGSDTA